MEPVRISPYTLIYIWVGVGFLAGLVLLLVGWAKGKTKLGALGLLASTVGGGLLGIFLIVPAVAGFLWLILRRPATTAPVESNVSDAGSFENSPDNAE